MKLLITVLMLALALPLYAQKPIIKFYLNDGKTSQYKIEDISEINFIKSNLSYSMEIFKNGSINTYNIKDINSIEFIDSTQIKINLSNSSENFNTTDTDSIIFIPNTCTEITIGTQTWMCKNLDVDHYRNGDTIIQVTDPVLWTRPNGSWCFYNNDPAMGEIYGKLYNWYAVNDPRGLAPEGWHVPCHAEWNILSDYLGGERVAGGKLKEAGTTHWASPNTGATNETGFSALPGGYLYYDGTFDKIGYSGKWWSSTENDTSRAWFIYLENIYLGDNHNYLMNGLAVRCIKDSDNPILYFITPTIVSIGDIITLTGTGFGASQGINYVSINDIIPQQSDYQSWSDTEIKVKLPIGATTGKLSITVNNQKSNKFSITVTTKSTDKVTIGNQIWKTKNLDVDHYRNGDPIPQVTNATEWANLTTGAWCYNNNDAHYGATYGKIYNWYAVNDSRGLAPDGWHIPSVAEWTRLTTYLGCDSVAGGKLKSTGTIEAGNGLWFSPNKGATNQTGFSALPGGYLANDCSFYNIGGYGYFWSSTENDTKSAFLYVMSYDNSWLQNHRYNKKNGLSVRCVKD